MEKQDRDDSTLRVTASEGTSHWLVDDEAELPEGVRQRGFRKEIRSTQRPGDRLDDRLIDR